MGKYNEPWYKKLMWILIDKFVLLVCAVIVLALMSMADFGYYQVQDHMKGKETVSIE